jgi:hypothetical protein
MVNISGLQGIPHARQCELQAVTQFPSSFACFITRRGIREWKSDGKLKDEQQ